MHVRLVLDQQPARAGGSTVPLLPRTLCAAHVVVELHKRILEEEQLQRRRVLSTGAGGGALAGAARAQLSAEHSISNVTTLSLAQWQSSVLSVSVVRAARPARGCTVLVLDPHYTALGERTHFHLSQAK